MICKATPCAQTLSAAWLQLQQQRCEAMWPQSNATNYFQIVRRVLSCIAGKLQ